VIVTELNLDMMACSLLPCVDSSASLEIHVCEPPVALVALTAGS